MYGYKPNTCPQCGRILVLKPVGHGFPECNFCATKVGLARSYAWHVTALSFAVVTFAGLLTYNHARRGTWLFCLLLLIPIVRTVVRALTPAWFTFAHKSHKSPFLVCYISALFIAYFVMYQGYGWIYVLLHASRSETQENLEILSVPIAWFFPQFLITPQSEFLDLLGVIATNSLFYAIPVLICWKVAQRVLRRNRVIRMGLSGTQIDDGDEE